jgi:hypothetical protein
MLSCVYAGLLISIHQILFVPSPSHYYSHFHSPSFSLLPSSHQLQVLQCYGYGANLPTTSRRRLKQGVALARQVRRSCLPFPLPFHSSLVFLSVFNFSSCSINLCECVNSFTFCGLSVFPDYPAFSVLVCFHSISPLYHFHSFSQRRKTTPH